MNWILDDIGSGFRVQGSGFKVQVGRVSTRLPSTGSGDDDEDEYEPLDGLNPLPVLLLLN